MITKIIIIKIISTLTTITTIEIADQTSHHIQSNTMPSTLIVVVIKPIEIFQCQ